MLDYLKNPFKRPIEKSTLEDWAKVFLDLARASFIALCAALFNHSAWTTKLSHAVLLLIALWLLIASARICRILGERL